MYLSEPTGANRRGDGRRADTNHRGNANARDDRRQRQRQLHLPEQLTRRHAERRPGLDERGVDRPDAGNRGPDDRQQRVDDEHGDGHPRTEAPDERQRQQEAEHREAWHGLRRVDQPDDRRTETRPPRRENAKGNADRNGDDGRDRYQEQVLQQQRAELGAVRGPEVEHAHE